MKSPVPNNISNIGSSNGDVTTADWKKIAPATIKLSKNASGTSWRLRLVYFQAQTIFKLPPKISFRDSVHSVYYEVHTY